MNEIRTLGVVGGDLRQRHLAGRLAGRGYAVTGCLLGEDLPPLVKGGTFPRDLKGLDGVILPLPVTADGETLNAPLGRETLTLEELVPPLEEGTLVLGGKIPPALKQRLSRKGCPVEDYLAREEMAVMNAVPTAEGAIAIAMEELPVTLFRCRCLVIGYGRVGRVLAQDLRGLGAAVTVAARRHEVLSWAQIAGCDAVAMEALEDLLPSAQVVFNTVPAAVLGEDRLARLSRDCLVIDLASKPGGVDFDTAARLGIRTIWALSLPGKAAPITAAEILKDTILNIIAERGR